MDGCYGLLRTATCEKSNRQVLTRRVIERAHAVSRESQSLLEPVNTHRVATLGLTDLQYLKRVSNARSVVTGMDRFQLLGVCIAV